MSERKQRDKRIPGEGDFLRIMKRRKPEEANGMKESAQPEGRSARVKPASARQEALPANAARPNPQISAAGAESARVKPESARQEALPANAAMPDPQISAAGAASARVKPESARQEALPANAVTASPQASAEWIRSEARGMPHLNSNKRWALAITTCGLCPPRVCASVAPVQYLRCASIGGKPA